MVALLFSHETLHYHTVKVKVATNTHCHFIYCCSKFNFLYCSDGQ